MTSRRILEQFPAVDESGSRYTILKVEESLDSDGDGENIIPSTLFMLETGEELSQLEPDTFEIIDYDVKIYRFENK